jgi:hypothetical protein
VLRTQKAKNPKAFALRVFVVAGAINQPSELLLRGTAKDCCVTQTTAVLGICTDGKANGRRQIPSHSVAAMGYRANPVCEYLCLHQCLVPNIDQTLSIDLGKNVSAESIGNGKQAVVGFDQRSSRADQRSSQTPPRAGMIMGQSKHPRRCHAKSRSPRPSGADTRTRSP